MDDEALPQAGNLDRGAEQTAKRFSVRPGYQLVGYREVGLPFYYLRLRAVVMAQKPVPPISEYVLKALDLGLKDEGEFGGFLGLQDSVIRRTLVDLKCGEDIDLIAPLGHKLQEWSLTEKGRTTLKTLAQIVPEELSLPVYYDGLLRRVVAREQGELLWGKELRDLGMMQIAPIPGRKPELDELTITEVNDAIKSIIRRGVLKRDLLVIKAVLSSQLLFQRSVMLVYQSLASSEIQVAFIVDGQQSPSHDQAFTAGGGLKRLGGIEQSERLSVNEIAEKLFAGDVLKRLGDLTGAENLKRQAQKAQAELEAEKERLRIAATEEERHTRRDRLKTVEETVTAIQQEVAQLPVTLVETYEHRDILEGAIKESRQRVLINSPWINARAVTHFLLRELERRLADGLKVFIAYGLDEEEKRQSPQDRDALNALRTLQRSYSKNFRLTCVNDTHAKVLISDSSFMVVTSFNWLSFRGDPKRTFRDERGIMVRIPSVIDDQFNRIVKRMDEAEQRR